MESWIHESLTGAEVITISPTGYTNENIALTWLNHFIKHVGAESNEHWGMLLLDSHSSHWQSDFIIKYRENQNIPFEFLSCMTNILQLLDVGIFRP